MNNIENYGYTDFYKKQAKEFAGEGLVPARITAVHKEQYEIIRDTEEKSAKLKGSLFYNDKFSNIYPTVGDFVLVRPNPAGDDVIYYVLERKSKFSRLDPWKNSEQVVAANFDYVFIMLSLNMDFNLRRAERYLTSAWQSGGIPVLIMTKADLCEDYEEQERLLESIAPGVPVIAISSYTGEGIEKLKEYFKPGKTVVFLGSSGVGKSSLVNAVSGSDLMKVSEIRENDSKGHHTTTHRQLIALPDGTMIIDTPGMRELGMWEVSEGLDNAFSDIDELAEKCRFRDCTHQKEPGCAVKAAIESGELPEERWNNYLKLKKEARFLEGKENAKIRQEDAARWKAISKAAKQISKKTR